MEELSLIDVSSEDDLLAGISAESGDAGAADLKLPDSPNQTAKSCKFNLRKSLAWDRAFFTSEGVLNDEELGIVNSAFHELQNRKLPGIVEEVRASFDSTSTLDNDSRALDNLEAELFENVRASIQRSICKSGKIQDVKSSIPGEDRKASNTRHVGSQHDAKQTFLKKSFGRSPAARKQEDIDSSSTTASSSVVKSTTMPRPPRISSKGAPAMQPREAKSSSISQLRVSTDTIGKRKPNSRIAESSSHATSRTSILAKKAAAPSTLLASSTSGSTSVGLPNKTKRTVPRTSERTLSGASNDSLRGATSRNKIASAVDLPSVEDQTLRPSNLSPSSSISSVSSDVSSAASLVQSGNCLASKERAEGRCLNNCAGGTLDSGNSHGKSFKPSGLRMPTPKIGYFGDAKVPPSRPASTVKSSSSTEQHARSALSSANGTTLRQPSITQQISKSLHIATSSPSKVRTLRH